jgi:hypothetical protein
MDIPNMKTIKTQKRRELKGANTPSGGLSEEIVVLEDEEEEGTSVVFESVYFEDSPASLLEISLTHEDSSTGEEP